MVRRAGDRHSSEGCSRQADGPRRRHAPRQKKEPRPSTSCGANFLFSSSGPARRRFVVTSALDNGSDGRRQSRDCARDVRGEDVIIVETDLRRPNLTACSAPRAEVGLGGRGRGPVRRRRRAPGRPAFQRERHRSRRRAPNDFLERSRRPDSGACELLPPGASTLDAGLSAENVAALANDLKQMANFVIFDSPALLSASAAVPLAISVDNVFVVAREGFTRRHGAEGVRAMLASLEPQGAPSC